MNICVLTHTFPKNAKDGTAAFMEPFVNGLVEAGNNVVLITPFHKEFKRSGDKFKIIKYKYIWPDKLHLLGYSRSMKADVSLKFANYIFLPFLIFFGTISLLKTIKDESIDIINVHWILPNGLIAYFASKLSNVPYVITLPGTDVYLARKNKIFSFITKMIANSSSGILSNSHLILKRILNMGLVNKPNDVIPYPVNVFALKPKKGSALTLRNELGIKNECVVIMAIGRLVYKKGFYYLIKAMPQVIKYFSQVKLIIGGDGDLRKDLTDMVKRLKLTKFVLFTGNINRDKILEYYNIADIFVAPSIVDQEGNVDGGPVVSYESMACGKTQIATNVLGVSDIIKDGVNGYVVKQKDSGALANALNKLVGSKKVREKMGIENRKKALSIFSTKEIGIRYSIFFRKILKNEK